MMYPNRSNQRVNKYEKFRLLREGEHEKAFQNEISNYGKAFQYDKRMGQPTKFMTVNLPKEICRVTADLIFYDKPKVTVSDREVDIFLQACFDKLKLFNLFFEGLDYGSALGDVVYKIRVYEGELVVEPVNPSYYHPTYDGYELVSHQIWNPRTFTVGNDEVEGALVEEYTSEGLYTTLIDQEYNEYDLSLVTDTEPFQPLENGLDYVVHIKNSGNPFSLFGTSDLEDITDLLFEVDNRTSRIASVLNKHSSPILKVPAGYAEELSKGRRVDLIEILEKEEDIDIQYISWDGKIEASFQELENTVDMVLTLSNITPSLLNRNQGKKAESAEALKYRLFRTLAMKRRKEVYWKEGIETLLYNLQKISVSRGLGVDGITLATEPVKPTVTFSEEFFTNDKEALENTITELNNGLITKTEAVKRRHDISTEEAEELIEEINEQ